MLPSPGHYAHLKSPLTLSCDLNGQNSASLIGYQYTVQYTCTCSWLQLHHQCILRLIKIGKEMLEFNY